MKTATYRAWAINDDGDLDEYSGLTRSRAIWRYRWHTRLSGRLRLKQWGWEIEE